MNTPVGSTWGFETFTGLIQLRFGLCIASSQVAPLRFSTNSDHHTTPVRSSTHTLFLCLAPHAITYPHTFSLICPQPSGAGGHYSKTVSGPEGLAGAFYDYARAHENGTWAPFHDDRHSTVSLTEEAIAVMQRHADSNGNGNSNGHEAAHGQNTEGEAHEAKKRASSPLFLYVAYTAGHTPLQADDAWLAKCTHLPHAYRRDYCGLLYGVDEVWTDPSTALRQQSTAFASFFAYLIFPTRSLSLNYHSHFCCARRAFAI